MRSRQRTLGLAATTVVATLGYGCDSPIAKSTPQKSEQGPTSTDTAIDDPTIAEAVPVSLFDQIFLAEIRSSFDASAIDPGFTSSEDAQVAGSFQSGFGVDTVLYRLFSDQTRVLSACSKAMGDLFGDGGPFGSQHKVQVLLDENGRAHALYQLPPGPEAAAGTTQVFMQLEIDQADRERRTLDVFEQREGEARWGGSFEATRAADGVHTELRFRHVIDGGQFPPPPPPPGKSRTAPPLAPPVFLTEVRLSSTTKTAWIDFTTKDLETGYGPYMPNRRLSILRFNDDAIRITTVMQFLPVPGAPAVTLPLPPFMIPTAGAGLVVDLVAARHGDPISVVKAAYVDANTLAAIASGVPPEALYSEHSLAAGGREALYVGLGDPELFPCKTLGKTIKAAFAEVDPDAKALAAIADVPDDLCGSEHREALETLVTTTCQTSDFGVVLPTDYGSFDVCKFGYLQYDLLLRNDMAFVVEDGRRRQLVAPTSAHEALLAKRPTLELGFPALKTLETPYEEPNATFDPATAVDP